MSTELAVVSQNAASLVKRSRAGDQNATAMLLRIGEEARKGGQRAVTAFQAVKSFIDSNPAQEFSAGADEPVLIADGPVGANDAPLTKPVKAKPSKPPVPRGLLDKLFNPEHTALSIVRACQYRNGMPAAAAVLAAGAPLSNGVVKQFGETNFGSEESRAAFFHGVKNPDVETWDRTAPHIEAPLRRCLAIGQCFGRARQIQAVRAGSPISTISPTAGWELGE